MSKMGEFTAGGVRRALDTGETDGTSAKNQYLTYDFHRGSSNIVVPATRYRRMSRRLTVSCHEDRRATAVAAQAQPPPHLDCYSFRNGEPSSSKISYFTPFATPSRVMVSATAFLQLITVSPYALSVPDESTAS